MKSKTTIENFYFSLLKTSIFLPRQAADVLRALPMNAQSRLYFFMFVLITIALVAKLGQGFGIYDPSIALLLSKDVSVAGFVNFIILVQALLFSTGIFFTHYLGRMVGGNGSFAQTVVMIGWVQLVANSIQLFQIVLVVFARFLAFISFPAFFVKLVIFSTFLIDLASLPIICVMGIVFIMRLHGFTSVGKTIIGTVVTLVSLLYIISLVLVAFGFSQILSANV